MTEVSSFLLVTNWSPGMAESVSNKDKAGKKQLAWEQDRDKFMQGGGSKMPPGGWRNKKKGGPQGKNKGGKLQFKVKSGQPSKKKK